MIDPRYCERHAVMMFLRLEAWGYKEDGYHEAAIALETAARHIDKDWHAQHRASTPEEMAAAERQIERLDRCVCDWASREFSSDCPEHGKDKSVSGHRSETKEK